MPSWYVVMVRETFEFEPTVDIISYLEREMWL